uniref:Class III HD-Zip protein HDZ33 n=1 Tax=Selaginella moellendorffii TaxID=88036 RepID=Q147S2_SELML|nr:TPA_inf: class III HD-Zip protein HDZ33 [Selaginella moellendorffii]
MDPQNKYARYTNEQLEILELVYNECPKPSSLRRQQLMKEAPILANIAPKQLKVWFQNRRCREKQRKETSRLHGLNSKLTALNKILVENNDHLAKQSTQLTLQKHTLRKHLYGDCSSQRPPMEASQVCRGALAAGSSEIAGTSELPNIQHLSLDHGPVGLSALAEQSLADFLAKATGTAVDWIQLLGMKPGPDSFGIVAISHGCDGIAARALGLVALEATRVSEWRIVEVLKDKTSWLWDCRRSDVIHICSSENGSTMEIMHTQLYAPTTLAPPRDFCTLRLTTSLEDGNLVVCERSISDAECLSYVPSTQYFVRAEMLTSGYLVRPCEGGSCIVHIIDHLDLKPSSVSEVLTRPLYRSSSLLAQRMTVKALRFLKHLAQEEIGEIVVGGGQQPSVLRSLSRRMARGFNDAVNGFPDDGWCTMGGDGLDNVAVSCNATINFSLSKFQSDRLSSLAGVLCAKASMLLQNVHPSYLIRFLRDHRSEWGCNMDFFQQDAASRSHGKRQAHVPLFHTAKEDFLEAVILEGHYSAEDGTILSREIYLLQLCSGIEDEDIDGCSQLIFAPVDANLSDDMPLLSSGFRVLPLCDDMDDIVKRQSDSEELRSGKRKNHKFARSILTIAFQFMYEVGTRDTVAEMARNYIRNVMDFVQRITLSLAASSLGSSSADAPFVSSKGASLIHQILQSYSVSHGVDIIPRNFTDKDAIVMLFWHYAAAIICCSLKATPEFVIANQAGLQMLETKIEELQTVSWERTIGYGLDSELAKLLREENGELPEGIAQTSKGKRVCYERGLVWRVDEQHLALMFVNWSFQAGI